MNQNDNLHRLMPVFNPVDGLSFAYIVAASPGYTNPRIAIATVGDLNSETFITDPGDLPSPFNFHQLTYKSDGSAVLFDNGKDIFAASTVGGGVTQLTLMDATSFVYNPEVVKIDGVDWIVSGARDSTTTALVGWQYETIPTNADDVVEVVNFNETFNGREDYPRVSSSGNVFTFHLVDKTDTRIARSIFAKGLSQIVEGITVPITSNGLPEERVNNSGSCLNFPVSVGLLGHIAVYALDFNGCPVSSNYNLNLPGNFLSSDFDLYVDAMENISSLPGRISAIARSTIPFPGNQPFASLDKNGTKLILCSDFNPFLPGKSEFSLLDMSLGVGVKVNDGYITGPLTVIDPSGVNLTFYEPDVVDIPSGQPTRIKVFTPRIQSTSEVVNIRTFEPSGTTFTPGGSGPGGIKLTYAYRDEDIQNLVESTLKIAAYDILAATTVILPTTVDAENNSLEARITHFSSYAITGDQIPGPASVENWALQE